MPDAVALFRKKPVVIEALQLRWDNWNAMCDFIQPPYFGGGVYVDADGREVPHGFEDVIDRLGMKIVTLEGVMLAIENDWIVKGIKGEFYPVKPDIFERLYERVDDEQTAQTQKG